MEEPRWTWTNYAKTPNQTPPRPILILIHCCNYYTTLTYRIEYSVITPYKIQPIQTRNAGLEMGGGGRYVWCMLFSFRFSFTGGQEGQRIIYRLVHTSFLRSPYLDYVENFKPCIGVLELVWYRLSVRGIVIVMDRTLLSYPIRGEKKKTIVYYRFFFTYVFAKVFDGMQSSTLVFTIWPFESPMGFLLNIAASVVAIQRMELGSF